MGFPIKDKCGATRLNSIAIHDRPGSFSDRWIEKCEQLSVPMIRVDMFSNELYSTLRANDVRIFMCHPLTPDSASNVAAKSIIKSLREAGLTVFPSVQDFWHFDDKIAQKYLFESMDIKCPKTYVFLRATDALTWLETAKMPLVCKLSVGAGSQSVSILRSRREAARQVERMFGRG